MGSKRKREDAASLPLPPDFVSHLSFYLKKHANEEQSIASGTDVTKLKESLRNRPWILDESNHKQEHSDSEPSSIEVCISHLLFVLLIFVYRQGK